MTGRVEGPSNIILITMTIYYAGSMDVEDTPHQFSVFSFQFSGRAAAAEEGSLVCSLFPRLCKLRARSSLCIRASGRTVVVRS